jgi:hypothetical protein
LSESKDVGCVQNSGLSVSGSPPPPHPRPIAGDLTKALRRQPQRACQAALAAASETTASAKNRGCTTNVHGLDFALKEAKRNA